MEITPCSIEVLLHFHSLTIPHPRAESPEVAEAIVAFMNEGILRRRPGEYVGLRLETTERGKAWVTMLCSTPFPERVWRNPLTGSVFGG